MDLSLGVRTNKYLAGFAGPIPFFGLSTLQQWEYGHHALQGPHANMFALRNHDFSALDREIITDKHRLIAIPVDFLDGYLQFIGGARAFGTLRT